VVGYERKFDGVIPPFEKIRAIDPEKFRGMTEAAAILVQAIRHHYPSIKIMLNRAYEILPLVEKSIDMVLGESIHSDYDFESGTYRLVEEELYHRQVEMLQEARRRNPKLRIFTLDYWDPVDRVKIKEIYRVQRANGFIPYVATINLDQLVEEPDE